MRPSLALLAVLTACQGSAPALRVVSATEVGVVPHAPTIRGRDGGYTADLWGRVVWSFGDTVLEVKDEQSSQWHTNSMSYTEERDASDGLAVLAQPVDAVGAPRLFVPFTADEAAFNEAHAGDPCRESPCNARWALWPGPMVFDAVNGRALVFYGLVSAAPGDFNFHGVGQGLATWRALDAEVERPVVRPGAPHPTLLFDEGEPAWGAAALVEEGNLYVFGTTKAALAFPCKLARVPVAQALDRAAWTFWKGDGWSAEPQRAADLFDCNSMVSVSRNEAVGGWLAVYSQPLTNEVRYRTAKALTGPWSEAAKAFEADHRSTEGWTYDALEHPELAQDGGRTIFVTYTRPNQKGWLGSDLVLEKVVLQ